MPIITISIINYVEISSELGNSYWTFIFFLVLILQFFLISKTLIVVFYFAQLLRINQMCHISLRYWQGKSECSSFLFSSAKIGFSVILRNRKRLIEKKIGFHIMIQWNLPLIIPLKGPRHICTSHLSDNITIWKRNNIKYYFISITNSLCYKM